MRTIEIDERTFERLRAAARLAQVRQRTSVTEGQVVAELVSSVLGDEEAFLAPTSGPKSAGKLDGPHQGAEGSTTDEVEIFSRYKARGTATHEETEAVFNKKTGEVTIGSGPLAGQRFGSLSAAAMALVRRLNPSTTPNRDGWQFWRVRPTGEAVHVLRERGEIRGWIKA